MVKCGLAMTDGGTDGCQMCCCFCDHKEGCEEMCDNITADCEDAVEEETELQVMESAVPDAIKVITEITVQKKKLDEQEKIMKQKLQEAMEKYGIKKFENDKVVFTYTAPTTRTTIDSDKLKKEYPDIAKECSKVSKVSASVRIKVK